MSYWQNPFVSLLKTYRPNEKARTQGAVRAKTNNLIRSQVWSISGDISAKNFIQVPANGHVSLNGRFFYLAFRPTPLKYFVFHLDIASEENFTCRVSFSNMYKNKRLAANMAQFPFVIPPKRSTVADLLGNVGCPGRAPEISGWLMFIVDLKQLLRIHFGRTFSHIRQVQLCSDMTVKGCYTSDTEYDPKISIKQARAEGFRNISDNLAPMPREMNFVVERNDFWDRKYQMVRPETSQIEGEIHPERISPEITSTTEKYKASQRDSWREEGNSKKYGIAATCGFTAMPVDDGDHILYGCGKNIVRMSKETLAQQCYPASKFDIICVVKIGDLTVSSEVTGELRVRHRERLVSIISTSIIARFMDFRKSTLVIAGKCTKLGSSHNSVALWNLSDPYNPVEICRGSTDQQINDLVIISKREPLEFVTGGDRGVRIWRTRHQNHLRSAAVNLGTQATSIVNTLTYSEMGLFAGTKGGTLLRIDPERMTLLSAHQLFHKQKSHEVTAILARENCLLVGTSDGLVRSWTPEYERIPFELALGYRIVKFVPTDNPVEDEVLVVSDAKLIGLLNVPKRQFRTLTRFHRSRILFCAFTNNLLATASRSDVRIWDSSQFQTLVQILQLELPEQLTALALDEEEKTLALGFVSGRIDIYELSGDKPGKLRGSLSFNEGSVRSLVYHSQSVLYTLDSQGDIAVVLYSNGRFHVSRSITDGANRHSTNKLVPSPDGKFITTLCRSSRSKIQLYSPYLDQIAKIQTKNEGCIINWIFIAETVLIVVLEDYSSFQISISKNKIIQRQKLMHYATDADRLLFTASVKAFTLSYARGQLKLWSPTMKMHIDDVECPERVTAIDASSDGFAVGGEQLCMFLWFNETSLAKAVDKKSKPTALYETISPTDVSEAPCNLLRALDLNETHDVLPQNSVSSLQSSTIISDPSRDVDVPSPIPRVTNSYEHDYDDLNVTPDDDSIERDTTAFSHSQSQYFPPVPPIKPVIMGASSH
ncbi:Oidioi.mRNA.OKI2018_I69.XSR.g13757.t1.cds [Oikopleura dioica]|uniref:Oidioi.mRNA.OKI2018_I69.XSR.g13757.t1.cds n=1 Tax=Oikopleura dioica TaxID=34765 RepID=A0ABN7SBR8_OIKDI|nr:Oidioi.mRNA.OKI2018_I69.XSR.g13757.t1.cds [Oikopleura dioica]